jgi:hypothetical protein
MSTPLDGLQSDHGRIKEPVSRPPLVETPERLLSRHDPIMIPRHDPIMIPRPDSPTVNDPIIPSSRLDDVIMSPR